MDIAAKKHYFFLLQNPTSPEHICDVDGPNAACLASKSEIIELQPPRVKVKRLTGAGDVLMASHIAKVLKGEDNVVAFKYAIEQTSKFISEGLTNETN